MKIMDTQDPMIAVGLIAALACGVAVGIFNYALILVLRIPPIIATLSSSFVILSAAMPSRLLTAFPPGTPVRRLTLDEAIIADSSPPPDQSLGQPAALGHQGNESGLP